MPDAIPPLPRALDLLLRRASVPARLLHGPAPDEASLSLAVSAAIATPDHGGLQPWRFVFVSGDDRMRLGDVLADSLARLEPGTPAERLETERAKPLRAPLVVAAGAALRHDRPKVPVWEQKATVAAGTMNFLNALEALGFGAIWVSSASMQDEVVKQALGFAAADALLGWIYVGTPEADRPRPVRPDPAGFARHWSPPG